IANADRYFARFEDTLGGNEKSSFAALLRAYHDYSDNLKGVATVLRAGDMDAYLKQGTQGVQDKYMTARTEFIEQSELASQGTMDRVSAFSTTFVSSLVAILVLGL